jgi:hypothetical protein
MIGAFAGTARIDMYREVSASITGEHTVTANHVSIPYTHGQAVVTCRLLHFLVLLQGKT